MESLSLSIHDGIAHLRLTRPDRSNAFDLAGAHAFDAAVRRIERDDDARVVLLSGAGSRFCAGGDVSSMIAAENRGAYVRDLADTLDAALQRLDSMTKPTVVAVQGAVAGAGIGVMLAGDLIVAERATKFVTAYAGIGLTPDCGVSWLLPRAVGQMRALQMILTPTVVDGETALSWGLVSEVVGTDALARAEELARSLAAGPAEALGHARRLLRTSWSVDRATGGAEETRTIERAILSPEAAALIDAFGRG
ncbi:enoyl-CoA hydratase/isomerase family protein [Aeromicrobium ginsengisoli]|uniref:Enoyl-CoA hydratase/isomerase family protein n=1 Tax=Aeromicrobium ginsengisoli TaxID=363867 RepID=A0A5M4F9I5_9ACTN|nr:enoyl-CoA hydratase/isomerase family protein [Aeromicrobium ginsengisoli]KAA1394306.1 enoyl-CoA hydratase/isomerase family protein [Aeromicrobium ginsengisoli]